MQRHIFAHCQATGSATFSRKKTGNVGREKCADSRYRPQWCDARLLRCSVQKPLTLVNVLSGSSSPVMNAVVWIRTAVQCW